MVEFAQLDRNGVVQRVIVISDKHNSNIDGEEDESFGISYCRLLYGEDTFWRQIKHRGLASPGMIYNEECDRFIVPRPYASWTLSSEGIWNPPIEQPTLTDEQIESGFHYIWQENEYQIDPDDGWFLVSPS